ncbi:UNVERIFIED_CONTAM: hypothetical protein FKN15_045513 [Acipenser sinensis]
MVNVSGQSLDSLIHQQDLMVEKDWVFVLKVIFALATPIFFIYVNCIMLFTLYSKASFQETSRYILFAHMLFNDSILLLTSVLLYILALACQHIMRGLCVFLVLISGTTFINSPLNLAVMALERYIAICLPLRHGEISTPKRTGVVIGVIWVLSSLEYDSVIECPDFGWVGSVMQDRTHRSTRTHCGVCILSFKMLLVLGFIILIMAQQTLCEMYTSVVNVQQAIAVEKDLLKYLNSYIEDETLRLNDLKRFYGKVSNLHANVFQGAGTAMANPLFAYTLIKRLQSEWLNVVYSNEANENTQAFKSGYEKEESRLPKFEDLQGAAKGLMRLQDVYALSVKGLVNGLFQRDTAGGAVDIYRAVNSITLSGDDCFLIGKVAYEMEDYYHSVLWLEPAASLFRRAYRTWNTEDEGSLEDVLDHLAFTHFKAIAFSIPYRKHTGQRLFLVTLNVKTGNVSYALSLSREILHLDPSNKRVTRNIEKYEKILAASPANSDVLIQRPNTTYLQTRNTYEWLCQTLGSQPRHFENPRLHCDFHTNSNPALVLKPMRREVVSLQPYVVLYHSFISDHEAKTIKEFSAPGLQRSVVASGVKQSTAEYRISKSAWLKDTAHPVVQKLDQRIAALTGLNVHPPYAEYLQVVNYGIGGHYEPHFDHATLNSVEAGGSTAFIYANFSVPVVKNAALFWWNLHRNGKGNGDTLHAGCPVLVGDKWGKDCIANTVELEGIVFSKVANKWVHEFGQEFQRRCSPNPDE